MKGSTGRKNEKKEERRTKGREKEKWDVMLWQVKGGKGRNGGKK
jgi:hypothetical protein